MLAIKAMLNRLCIKRPIISLLPKFKLPSSNKALCRQCVTNAGVPSNVASSLHRTAFVGVSVGIATPALIPVGVATVWIRILPKQSSFIKLGVYGIIGGGLLPLLYHYVLPFLKNYSDVIMPFALANGITASALYGFSELLYGLNIFKHQILGFSSVGPLVGVGTAILAPLLWPVLFKLCWNNDLQSIMFKNSNAFHFMDLYYEFLLVPVSLPLGIFSGIAIGNILTPIMLGAKQSMNIATVATSAVAFIYFYIFRAGNEDYYYEVRTDPATLQRTSYNLLNKNITKNDDGRSGYLSLSRRNTVFYISKITELPRLFFNLYIANNVTSTDAVTTSSMNDMYIRDEIIPLIDVLLRAKYKMMNNLDNTVTSDSDHYRDVDKMFKYVEVAVALKKSGNPGSSQEIEKIKDKIIRECIKSTSMSGELQAYFADETQRGKAAYAVEKLLKNLDVMEAELKSRLNYEVNMSVLEKHAKQEQYDQLYTIGKVTAAVAAIVSILLSM